MKLRAAISVRTILICAILFAGQTHAQTPPPEIYSIDPARASYKSATVDITDLEGSYFADGMTVKLSKSGQSDIVATSVTILDDYMATCTFDIHNAAEGAWDVVATNPDGQSATLPGGFYVSWDNWAAAGSMSSARYGHAAAQLHDGKILVTGGMDADGNTSASAEIYAPATGSWHDTTPMSRARTWHTATTLPDGKVLAAGGADNNGYVPDAEVYNPFTGLWSATIAMIRGHFGHAATQLPNGKVLISGGDFSTMNFPRSYPEEYSQDSNNWTAAGEITGRRWHTATSLSDGRILVAGGLSGYSGKTQLSEIYDSTTKTWTWAGNTEGYHSNHAATLLPDSTVLIAGGGDTAEIYNPVTQTWTRSPDMLNATKANVVLLSSGKVMVAGGEDTNNNTEIYDPRAGTWRLTVPMSQSHNNDIAMLLPSGKVLVAGGQDSSNNPLSSAEVFEGYGTTGFAIMLISPNSATPSSGTITINLTGLGLSNTTAKLTRLGQPDIVASNVSFMNPTQISCAFDITGAVSGFWNVVVTNSEGLSAAFTNAFSVLPTIGSITPNVASNSADIDISLEGTGFAEGATVKLVKSGQPDIVASNVRVLADKMLVCTLPITGAGEGTWDVVIVNPESQSATFPNGFILGSAWLAAASMPQERESHTATILPNGTILVAGGYNYNTGETLNSAFIYNPNADTWKAIGNMLTARSFHAAAILPNGSVLVAGGYDSEGNILSSAELYDSATGSWTATGSLLSARFYHALTLLSDGRVLVSGGRSTNVLSSAEIYDIATGSWTLVNFMSQARYSHTSTLLANGKVLVTGGVNIDGNNIASAEIYDPATGNWSTAGSMSQARSYHTATLLPNSKVLITGGGVYEAWGAVYDSSEIYNPETSSWAPTGSMLNARFSHTATPLSNGNVLVSGGFYDYWHEALNSAEVYNVATGTWSYTSFMSQPRGLHTATALSNNKVVAVGGKASWSSISSAEIYKYAGATAPAITFVSPQFAPNNANATAFNVIGNGFTNGLAVKLTKSGQADISAVNVAVLSSMQITCTLPVLNVSTGTWNVIVANPDGQTAVMPNAFVVTSASGPANSATYQGAAVLTTSSNLSETLRAESIAISGAVSTGTLVGTVAYSSFTLVTVHSGGFYGKGFARAAWNANLEGVNYSGTLKAMAFYSAANGRIYLKGATSGDIPGTFDGYIGETAPGSGVYDQFYSVLRFGHCKTSETSGTLYFSGTASRSSEQDYPNTSLKLIQENLTGNINGYISSPMNAILTHLRVGNPGNPYNGEGYVSLSYLDNQGDGKGWAYATKPAGSPVLLNGFLDKPTYGLAAGLLNDIVSPNTISLNLERVDAGQVAAHLHVNVYLSKSVNPGQVISEQIELVNDGMGSAQNVDLVAVSIPYADFLSASGKHKEVDIPTSYGVVPIIRWSLPVVPAKSIIRVNVQYKMRTYIGDPHEVLEGKAFVIPTSTADAAIPTIDIKESYDDY